MTATRSFKDAYGATVTVPPDTVTRYVGAKADQLTALTRLLADVTAGNVIEPSEADISRFALMADELAHALAELLAKVMDGGPAGNAGSAKSTRRSTGVK